MTLTEEVREAAAQLADAHASIEGIAQKIAAAIRAMPLPEAPKDERLLAELLEAAADMMKSQFVAIEGPGVRADIPLVKIVRLRHAMEAAGWRRNP